MENFLLSTFIVKRHRRTHRRLRLRVTKGWISKIPLERLQGRAALASPIPAIHLYYEMDHQKLNWAVLSQCKGIQPIDQIPHPLSYSSFSLVVEPYLERPSHSYGLSEPMRKALRDNCFNNRLQIKSTSVEFSHKLLDQTFGRCQDHDLQIKVPEFFYRVDGKCISKVTLHDSRYSLRCYLKLQYEVQIQNSVWRLVNLSSGMFPVLDFEPSTVLLTYMGLVGDTRFAHYWHEEMKPPTDAAEALGYISYVIEYFHMQEQYELLSIAKKREQMNGMDSTNLKSLIKGVLRLKMAHLDCLSKAIYESLAPLAGHVDHHLEQKIMQIATSGDIIARISQKFEFETLSLDDISSICNTPLTASFPAYNEWWVRLFRDLPQKATDQLYQNLVRGNSVRVPEPRWPKNSPKADWESKISSLTKWVQKERAQHNESHLPNSGEQDHHFLGSVCGKELAKMFRPVYQVFHRQGLSTSTFYHNQMVMWQDSEKTRHGSWTQKFSVPEGPDSHEILKYGLHHTIRTDIDSTLDWMIIPLKEMNLQTIFGFKGRAFPSIGEAFYLSDRWGRHNSFDSGLNHLIAFNRKADEQSFLASIQFEYPRKTKHKVISTLLSSEQYADYKVDRDYHMQYVHNPKRVFPLAVFDRDRLVLFAQLSVRPSDGSAPKPHSVGVQLYAFSHSESQEFALLCTVRHHAVWAYAEELRPPQIVIGWDTRRLNATRFWFRWRELAAYKIGIWVRDSISYSLHVYRQGRFLAPICRRMPVLGCEYSFMLMECKLGADQPAIGISWVLGVTSDSLRVECCLLKLSI